MADAKRNPGDRACALCRKPLAGTPPAQIECEFTPGAKKGDITLAHLDCFLYAPRSCHDDDVVLEDGSYIAKGILKESERAKRLKCYACKKTGACTGCYYPRVSGRFTYRARGDFPRRLKARRSRKSASSSSRTSARRRGRPRVRTAYSARGTGITRCSAAAVVGRSDNRPRRNPRARR